MPSIQMQVHIKGIFFLSIHFYFILAFVSSNEWFSVDTPCARVVTNDNSELFRSWLHLVFSFTYHLYICVHVGEWWLKEFESLLPNVPALQISCKKEGE